MTSIRVRIWAALGHLEAWIMRYVCPFSLKKERGSHFNFIFPKFGLPSATRWPKASRAIFQSRPSGPWSGKV